MDKEKYHEVKSLIDDIDRWSNHVKETVETIEDFKQDPETAILYVSANGHSSKITLSKELSEKFLADILESYYSLITKAQKNINNIINNTLHMN